jgi:hypothetical protein
MYQIRVATSGTLGVTALVFVAQGQQADTAGEWCNGRRLPGSTNVPGDPDLEGNWRGTNMAGVPLQRPESFGTRNVLNDAEFAHRSAKSAVQSLPQHWFERGETQRIVNEMIHESGHRSNTRATKATSRCRTSSAAHVRRNAPT